MKKLWLCLVLSVLTVPVFAQTVPIWLPWTAAWVRWDGGVTGGSPVSPYSGTPVLGDIIYFNGTNWVSLAAPANGAYNVTWTTSVPSWTAAAGGGALLSATDAVNTAPVRGGIVVANSTPKWAQVAVGANGTVLGSNGTDPSWGAIAVTAPVTNTTGNLGISITTSNDGGAIVKQASNPGTKQATAFWNVDGIGQVTHDGLTTTPDTAFNAANTTATSAGVTRQYSPGYAYEAHAWQTGTGADDKWLWRSVVQTGTASTSTSSLRFQVAKNAGGFTDVFQLFDAASAQFSQSIVIPNTSFLNITGRGTIQASADGAWNMQNNAGTLYADVTNASNAVTDKTNGGQLKRQQASEQLTLNTGSTTTATAGNLVPAACTLKAVLVRVTTTITTAANFTVKVTGGNVLNEIGTATTSHTTLTAGTTYTLVPAAFADQYYTSASTLTVTTNVNPGAGVIRFTVVCDAATPPTS